MRDLGRPNREQVVTTRGDRLSTLQALSLSNGKPFFDLIRRGADSLLKQHPKPDDLIDHVFRSALCRTPTPTEQEILREIWVNGPIPKGWPIWFGRS